MGREQLVGVCPACDPRFVSPLHRVAGLPDCTVVRCGRCGLVHLFDTRSPEAEHDKYRIDHFEEGYLESFDINDIVDEQLESTRKILERNGATLEAVAADAPILDIGCARGHFLKRIVEVTGNTDVVGLDVSPQMTAWGRDNLGLDLRNGVVESIEFPQDHFGLVCLFDVLEHLAMPREALGRILLWVRVGGWVVLECPSDRTLFRTMAKLGFKLSGGMLSRPLRALYHPAHISYFTPEVLERMIRELGVSNIGTMTKEAHITRFGLKRYSLPARVPIWAVSRIDKLLGSEAKVLCAFQRR